MRLPDINAKNIVGRRNDKRSSLIEIGPIHRAARYHGAERSIRSPTASASCSLKRSASAKAASAKSCWANVRVELAEWRRSWSVTHLENGTSRPSMMGRTSSGTLIVLLGMYVLYVHNHCPQPPAHRLAAASISPRNTPCVPPAQSGTPRLTPASKPPSPTSAATRSQTWTRTLV